MLEKTKRFSSKQQLKNSLSQGSLKQINSYFSSETTEARRQWEDTYRLKVKGWKKIFHTNGEQKKAGVAILISDKIDFQIKAVKRDKEGHYIMIKGLIQEEDIIIINIYAPNIGAPQYVRQMLTSMKVENNNNTM